MQLLLIADYQQKFHFTDQGSIQINNLFVECIQVMYSAFQFITQRCI